jgi:hypothetical protein
VAVVTGTVSGLVVLGLDRGHGHGADGLESVRAAGRDLPATRRVRTPSGGLHCYYVHPGGAVPNATDLHGLAGVDLRGDGGYVVAPPSRSPAGVYVAEKATRRLPLAALPAWVLAPQAAPAPQVGARPAGEWAALWVTACPQGQRNATCMRLAAHLEAHGIDEDEAQALLAGWSAACCTPPLGADEVRRTVASAYRTAGRRDPLAGVEPAPWPEAEAAFAALPAPLQARLRAVLPGGVTDGRRVAGALADALRGGTTVPIALTWALDLFDGDRQEAARVLRWAVRAARGGGEHAH